MNSKERILAVINHEEPDKVPIDSWLAPEVSEALIKLILLFFYPVSALPTS